VFCHVCPFDWACLILLCNCASASSSSTKAALTGWGPGTVSFWDVEESLVQLSPGAAVGEQGRAIDGVR